MFLKSITNFQDLSPLPYRIDEDELEEFAARQNEIDDIVSICRNLSEVFLISFWKFLVLLFIL